MESPSARPVKQALTLGRTVDAKAPGAATDLPGSSSWFSLHRPPGEDALRLLYADNFAPREQSAEITLEAFARNDGAQLLRGIEHIARGRPFVHVSTPVSNEALLFKVQSAANTVQAYGRADAGRVRALDVSRATLELPHLADLELENQRLRTTGADRTSAPMLFIPREIFGSEFNPPHASDVSIPILQEFYFDPRVDLRAFNIRDGKLERVKEIESRLVRFGKENPPEPATMERVIGCCVYVRPPYYSRFIPMFLSRFSFDRSKLHTAVLVHDTATRLALGKSGPLAKTTSAIPKSVTDVEGWVRDQIVRAKSGTLLLLAHIEGESYVVRDAEGNELGKVGINAVSEMALKEGVTLFSLGCKSARVLQEFQSIGVYESFNSLDMAKRLNEAVLKKPKTVVEFLEAISSNDSNIILPASVVRDPAMWTRLSTDRDRKGRPTLSGNVWRAPGLDLMISPRMWLPFMEGLQVGFDVKLVFNRRGFDGTYVSPAEMAVVLNPCAAAMKANQTLIAMGEPAPQAPACDALRKGNLVYSSKQIYGIPGKTLR